MSRYNNTGGNSNDNNDDAILKLQQYAAIRCDGDRVNAFNGNWGDKFIAGFDNVDVIDGIVFQRRDKPMTVKVFSVDEFADLDPESGLVYHEDTGEELTAEEMLEMPEILGFTETFGDTKYKYNPVGVIIEAAEDIALNGDVFGDDVEGPFSDADLDRATDETVIPVGRVSMLLGNQSWVRTLAKKLTTRGDAIINDNGENDPDTNPKYADFDWLTTLDPEIRDDLKGRTMELWVTEETREYDDGEQTYTQPNLLDVKTSTEDNMNFVTIENGVDDDGADASASDADSGATPEAKADGGTATQSPSTDSQATSEPTSTDNTEDESENTANTGDGSGGLPSDVPDVLDDLLDYFARTQGEASAEELREFAEDEVDDADAVDWEAAAAEVGNRA